MYCERDNIDAKKSDTRDSLVWTYLTRNRQEVENHINWKILSWNCSFWWDNLLGDGALAKYFDKVSSLNNIHVADFVESGKWNERAIRHHEPPLLVPIILNFNIQYDEGISDHAMSMCEDKGQFTISSSLEIIRKKKVTDPINNCVWHKNIPFKVSFFIWRALRGKLPTNESMLKFGKEEADYYYCYRKGKYDINHILIKGNFA